MLETIEIKPHTYYNTYNVVHFNRAYIALILYGCYTHAVLLYAFASQELANRITYRLFMFTLHASIMIFYFLY